MLCWSFAAAGLQLQVLQQACTLWAGWQTVGVLLQLRQGWLLALPPDGSAVPRQSILLTR